MRYPSYAEAFYYANKPACILTKRSPRFSLFTRHYPHLDLGLGNTAHIFFKTEEQMKSFAQQYQYLNFDEYYYHILLGKTLGFPIKSVEYYAEINDNEQHPLMPGKIGIDYAGITFVSHIDLLQEEMDWLWKTYPYPIKLEKISNQPHSCVRTADLQRSFPIRYQDYMRLKEIEQELRGLIQKQQEVINSQGLEKTR